jgi:hypothetical protein
MPMLMAIPSHSRFIIVQQETLKILKFLELQVHPFPRTAAVAFAFHLPQSQRPRARVVSVTRDGHHRAGRR